MQYRRVKTVVFAVLVSVTLGDYTNDSAGICASVDVRNNVAELAMLKGCRVIMGSLQIVLIDHADLTDYEQYSFPDLVEVTDYLLMYKVSGLNSVGKLLPSLTTLRGDKLLLGYALVIYQLPHLQELGLNNLTEISRGAVRIVENPELCFSDTIDWEKIVRWDADNNFISNNKDVNDCPGPLDCPESECAKPPCRTQDGCQQRHLGTHKCHPQCAGGCTGPGPKACKACIKYLSDDGACVHRCPKNTYLLLNRQCVSKQQCLSLEEDYGEIFFNVMFTVLKQSCVRTCLPGYAIREDKKGCVFFQGDRHHRVCQSAYIQSADDAYHLKGCTLINGSLEISIRQGNHIALAEELKESLESIEEIRGYLKIFRCFPLVDLTFFKNLKIIHGESKSVNTTFSLIVVDNANLVNLWNLTENGGFKLLRGTIFFHYNPKLCFHHIELLINVTKLKNVSIYEADPQSNGDRFTCSEILVNITFSEITATSVKVNTLMSNKMTRLGLQGLLLYFREASSTAITFDDDTDECERDSWKVSDVLTLNQTNASINQTNLKPFTLYAFFVKIFTVNGVSGHSNIHYVTTESSLQPSQGVTVNYRVGLTRYLSNSSSTIYLQWESPQQLKAFQYIITGYRLKDNITLLNQRDYCKHPMKEESQSVKYLSQLKSSEKSQVNKDFYYSRGKFGEISDSLFSSRLNLKPSYQNKNVINKNLYNFERDQNKNLPISVEIRKPSLTKLKISFFKLVNGTNFVTIRNLTHFGKYALSIRACKVKADNKSNENHLSRCSKPEMVTVRTLKSYQSDLIQTNEISHRILDYDNFTNILEIRWTEPKDPNGVILAFEVYYKRIDLMNEKPVVQCLTYLDYLRKGKSHLIGSLLPGIYTYSLRTISLAGKGEYTPPIKFEIEKQQSTKSSTTLNQSIHNFFIYALVVLVIVGICASYYAIFFRTQGLSDLDTLIYNAHFNSTTSPPITEDTWELSDDDIVIIKEIGEGAFGKVYKGILLPDNIDCVVKSVINCSPSHIEAYLHETKILKHAANVHHIVTLLGVVSYKHLIVTEAMDIGDLKTYLHSLGGCPVSHLTTFKISLQIADGMLFIERNKFVHRDLASRNCMIQTDLTVKLGDLGLSKAYMTDYFSQGDVMLPIRWMAPECFKNRVFSIESDVWSYGVVIWEILTLAELPFRGLSNEEVLHQVGGGLTLIPPRCSPIELQKVMLQCWMKDSACRPSFLQLLTQLERYADSNFKSVSYFHSTLLQSQRNEPPDDLLTDDCYETLQVKLNY